MNHIWAKIKEFFFRENKKSTFHLTEEDLKKIKLEVAREAADQERRFHEKNLNLGFSSADDFYVFQESIKEDEKKHYENLYHSEKKKNLFKKGRDRDKLVNFIASTGWTPSGFETAAYRAGTSDEITAIQDACFKKYTVDPIARNAVMNFQYFTIGKGVKVTSPVQEIDDFLIRFRRLNKMKGREKRMVRSCYIEGEYFLKYVIVGDDVYLRKIEPDRVLEIYYDDDDFEKVKGYKVLNTDGINSKKIPNFEIEKLKEVFNLSFKDQSPLRNEYIQHIKYGEEEFLRGSPPMYSILRHLKYYDDWLIDRIRLNHERAKVVWIKENLGGESTSANPMSAPKGGIMLQESQNIKYRIESAKLDSADAKEDGLAILYTIGSGLNMPLHIINQRTDQSVYSSIRKSDTPFSQMIEDSQELWREEFDQMYRFILSKSKLKDKKFDIPIYKEDIKIEAMRKMNEMVIDKQPMDKILKEVQPLLEEGKVKIEKVGVEDVPINQIFPQVVKEDSLEQAKVLFLHKKMGIVSFQTASEKAGYDWQEELARMSQEDFKDLEGDSDIDPEDSSDGGDSIPGLSDKQDSEPKIM